MSEGIDRPKCNTVGTEVASPASGVECRLGKMNRGKPRLAAGEHKSVNESLTKYVIA